MTAQQRIDQLRRYLRSDSVTVDGRIFLLSEIWDLQIEIAREKVRRHG